MQFILNNEIIDTHVSSGTVTLDYVRDVALLKGTKEVCREGDCGACTVLVNNKTVRSCQYSVKDIDGKEVLTIEGLAKDDKLHPLQKAFAEHDALQCGYCTPGMILNAYGLLLKNPNLTREEIIEGMEDNLCRCGAHTRIVQAI